MVRVARFAALAIFCVAAEASPGVYKANDVFVREAFQGAPPKAQKLWLSKDLQKQAAEILDHRYQALRLSYWRKGNRCSFILEEIGKEKPITVGVVVHDGAIESVAILAFREVRGYEVRTPAFTDQFVQATLTDDHNLSEHVDGITGATLSVRAVTKVARLALLFYPHTKSSSAP